MEGRYWLVSRGEGGIIEGSEEKEKGGEEGYRL